MLKALTSAGQAPSPLHSNARACRGSASVTHPQPFQADAVLARGRVPAAPAGRPVAAEWVADAVALVADRSAPGRPRLEDLATFRLEGS
jgi:hypothetical protein